MSYTVEPILGLRETVPGSMDGDSATNIEYNWTQIAAMFGAPVAWPVPPAISADGAAPAITQGGTGFLSKRGRLVKVCGGISVYTRTGGSGNALVSLPFVAANIAGLYPGIPLFQVTGFTPSVANCCGLFLRPTPGQASAHIISSNGMTAADEQITNIPPGMVFRFDGEYWADT